MYQIGVITTRINVSNRGDHNKNKCIKSGGGGGGIATRINVSNSGDHNKNECIKSGGGGGGSQQ